MPPKKSGTGATRGRKQTTGAAATKASESALKVTSTDGSHEEFLSIRAINATKTPTWWDQLDHTPKPPTDRPVAKTAEQLKAARDAHLATGNPTGVLCCENYDNKPSGTLRVLAHGQFASAAALYTFCDTQGEFTGCQI